MCYSDIAPWDIQKYALLYETTFQGLVYFGKFLGVLMLLQEEKDLDGARCGLLFPIQIFEEYERQIKRGSPIHLFWRVSVPQLR